MEETSQGFEKIARISQRNRNEYVPSKDKDTWRNIINTENIMDFFLFLRKYIIIELFWLACIIYLLVKESNYMYILFSTIFWSRNNSWQRNASIFKFQLAIIFASSIIIRFEIRPILAISNSLARFLTFFPRWLKVMKSTDQNVSSSKSKIVDGACT